jgi:hypothetical protein
MVNVFVFRLIFFYSFNVSRTYYLIILKCSKSAINFMLQLNPKLNLLFLFFVYLLDFQNTHTESVLAFFLNAIITFSLSL